MYVKGLPREAKQEEKVAIDLEMFGQQEGRLHRPHGTFACLSIAFENGESYLIEEVHDLRECFSRLQAGQWVFHNAAYDIRQLRAFVDIRQRPVWDTMLVEAGLFSGWYDKFSLGDLHRRWIGTDISKGLRGEFGTRSTLTDAMRLYSVEDAKATLAVAIAQNAYVKHEKISLRHYWIVDEPCMWAIIDMPPAKIDVDGWLKLAEHHANTGEQIQKELGFNVYSHTQTKAALEKAGIKVRNTNRKDTLSPLARKLLVDGETGKSNLVQRIVDSRVFRKAASTYGKDWVDQHVEEGGLVYGDYWTIGTRSSRMACSNPNLQNIPTRELPIFRRLFVSKFDSGIISVADSWQQEVCILAWMSQDKNLRMALEEHRDLHQETADDFGLSRRDGKDINLGLGYGMSAPGLASRVGISLKEADEGIRRRNERYASVHSWGDQQRRKAFAQEYLETSLGRRLWINRYDRQWERHAVNLPIQGTAAEHTKLWFVLCHKLSQEKEIPFRIPLVVHDELVSDVPPTEEAFWSKILSRFGTISGNIVVPGFQMQTSVRSGSSWGVKEE